MKSLTLFLQVILFLLFAIPSVVTAENLNKTCRCKDITPTQLWDADAWLWLSWDDKDVALNKHLP